VSAFADSFSVPTHGKGTYEITDRVAEILHRSAIRTGTATVFIRHTSASLIVFENADPSARTDLHRDFERLVPEDGQGYVHTLEGPDDTTSHIRSVLTATSLGIPVVHGRLTLGTWQGLFVFEHRRAPHHREVVVSIVGD
jgi:secondary thiamine-phosphate synthase enzyme